MLTIDRFEGNFAVIETNDGMINIPKSDLPIGAKEGDILTLLVDKDSTITRKKNIDNLMDDLFVD